MPRPPVFAEFLAAKEYFTTGEVSRISGIAPHILRYWENRVGILRPARRSSGHRRFGRKDLETILSLKDLIRGRGLTTRGARKAMLRSGGSAPQSLPSPSEAALRPQASASEGAAAKMLREVRKEINSLLEELK